MKFCKNIAEQIGLDVCHGWWLGGWWLVVGVGSKVNKLAMDRDKGKAILPSTTTRIHPPLRVRLSVLKLEPFQQ